MLIYMVRGTYQPLTGWVPDVSFVLKVMEAESTLPDLEAMWWGAMFFSLLQHDENLFDVLLLGHVFSFKTYISAEFGGLVKNPLKQIVVHEDWFWTLEVFLWINVNPYFFSRKKHNF